MEALLELDARLVLALSGARTPPVALLGLFLAAFVQYGLGWWATALLAARARGLDRRGLGIVVSAALGGSAAWLAAELLKLVVQRARPFVALPGVEPLVHPVTYSFPSGDAALSFGAAVALGATYPPIRAFALLTATAAGLSRIVLGVHYPSDVLAGALIGTAFGVLAVRAWGLVLVRLRWRIFVVAHTHWDREWYAPFAEFRGRLVRMCARLLDLMERDPSYRFTFDGQTIAIEDHLAVRPADRRRVESLVREGRLRIGPWYVLPDLLLVTGESIVRNLQEGLRVAASLGGASRVSYVADPFGHPAQLPQVLRGFGYETYVFSRGVGDEGDALGDVFAWQAPSGDRVAAVHLTAHYANALALAGPEDEPDEAVAARVRRVAPRLLRQSTAATRGSAVLFLVGDDHAEAYGRLGVAVAALRRSGFDARVSDLEAFAAAIDAPRSVHTGELVSGKYRPILRGVNATRTWIKQANAECERLLLERCEPLDALAGGAERASLRELWRTLLANHPHDSICGTGIDSVHDVDMAARFEAVRAGGAALLERLTERVAGPHGAPVVWSALPWERRAVVEVAGEPRLVECAALGSVTPAPLGGAGVSSPAAGVLENAALRVEVAGDGSFVVVDRATGERSGRLNELHDDGDRGDLYTFEYAGPSASARGRERTLATQVRGDRVTVTCTFDWPLPAALRDDRLARVPRTVDCPVRVAIALDADARHAEVTVSFDNRVRDHRLRAICDTGARTASHLAGSAFGWIERSNRVRAGRGWVEPPTADHCAGELVAVAASGRGMVVGLDGLYDYAVSPDGATVQVTLLRAVGWLSRGDLRARRGHAGPALETPGAQCPGPGAYRYAVVPFVRGREGVPSAARIVREWLSPPWVARGTATGAGCTWLGDDAVRLTSVRAAARPGAIVARLANQDRAPAGGTLRFARAIRSARAVDLREGEQDLGANGLEVIRTASPPAVEGAELRLALAPYEIGTYLIELE